MTAADMLADLVADPRPPARMLARLQALDAAGDEASAALGASLFESIHYRLPAFSDDELPAAASRLYGRLGRADAALLLAGLAVQLRPYDAPALAHLEALRATFPGAGLDPALAEKAAAMLRQHEPGQKLMLALEAMDEPALYPACAALFEHIWPRVRPMAQYWVYHRMSAVYTALDRTDAAALMSSLAIQIEPVASSSDMPHRRLLDFFRKTGRPRDAAELVARRAAFCPTEPLLREPDLSALMVEAGPLLLSPPPMGRTDKPLIPEDPKPSRPWRHYGAGVPLCLEQMRADMLRPPIAISLLRNAELLIDNGALATFGADGVPHIDLSMRCFPPLLRRSLVGQADGPGAAEEIELDEAVVLTDEWPSPNLCHFLLDHATRLELYRRARVDIGAVTAIGPDLRHEYQSDTAARLGVRSYLGVNRRARVRVSRLWVSSNCHTHRHPAHWGAPWAVDTVREKFDLVPRLPARRLLISRRDSPWRRLRNEAQLMELLEPLGFEIIVPGDLSFHDQIAAFRDATHVVAPHGAGLTNILWCAPGTHVLEVFHPHYGTWAYAMLKDVLHLDYATLVARDADSEAPEFNDTSLPREQMVPHAGRDMWVDPNELERWLVDIGVL
jgi:hypothetical protein